MTKGAREGAGAVLGVRVLRYSGVQGLSIAIASVFSLVNLFVVAAYLGPSELGRFALLLFTAQLLSVVLTIACKPGTLRRTFGEADDEDEDEDEEEVSSDPKRSLGTGIALAVLLALAGGGVALALREPIAEGLLGSSDDANLVVWAVLLGAATGVFRLLSIVIWFERRPGAFLACELSRPALTLAASVVVLAAGGGLEEVLAASLAATLLGGLVGIFILRGSFSPAFDMSEVKEIVKRGGLRAPVIISFWTIGNADVFLLSRYVSDTDLGIYTLASRVGFIAAFFPQGFRVAMRPLRKAAIFQAVEDQYGRAVQRGQTLGYFVLVCIGGVLAMVLASRALTEIAPDSFSDAAPLIPLAAAGMVWPALLRTVNQNTSYPGRTRRTFIYSSVIAALGFVGLTLLLAPVLDIYAPPVAMIGALAPPCAYAFVRCQRGPGRIRFPYREIGLAAAIAGVFSAVYLLLPDLHTAAELAIAAALGGGFLVLLFALRIVPDEHRPALAHMGRSLLSGRPDEFNPRRGLRALEPGLRDELRAAIEASWAVAATGRGDDANGDEEGGDERSERLVRALRRVGARGGMSVAVRSEHDARIARYAFADVPAAVRNATLRRLLAEGAEAADLRRLEDLVTHLATVPDAAWAGERKNSSRDGSVSQSA